jgi:glycerol-3-phosphate dehydrogenase
MNVAVALTAIQHGAAVANHVEVVKLLKNTDGDSDPKNGKLCGAVVRDTITGDTWTIKAKCIINATGPFCGNLLIE